MREAYSTEDMAGQGKTREPRRSLKGAGYERGGGESRENPWREAEAMKVG